MTPEVQIKYQDRVVTRAGETQVVYKDRIVTVTKTVKPDGTVTEITKTEDKDKSTDKKTSETAETKTESRVETPVLAAAAPNDYSLGLMYHNEIHSYSDLLNLSRPGLDNLELTGGYRLLGDLWMDIGVVPTAGVFSLGVSIKF